MLRLSGNARTMRLILAVMLLVFGMQVTYAQDEEANVELIGPIGAMTDTSITVNNQEIAIEPGDITEILGLGTSVIVDAQLQPDGALDAESIRIVDGRFLLPGELLISGIVEESTGTEVALNGVTIDTSNLDQPEFETGSRVWLIALADPDGTLMARNVLTLNAGAASTIEAQTTAEEGEALAETGIVFFGTLQEIDEENNTAVVAGRTFDTSNAELEGDLLPGTLVEVWLGDDADSAARITNANLFESAVTILDSDTGSAGPSAEATAEANPDTGEAVG